MVPSAPTENIFSWISRFTYYCLLHPRVGENLRRLSAVSRSLGELSPDPSNYDSNTCPSESVFVLLEDIYELHEDGYYDAVRRITVQERVDQQDRVLKMEIANKLG